MQIAMIVSIQFLSGLEGLEAGIIKEDFFLHLLRYTSQCKHNMPHGIYYLQFGIMGSVTAGVTRKIIVIGFAHTKGLCAVSVYNLLELLFLTHNT